MLTPVYTKQFSKDIKKLKNRVKNFDKFRYVSERLINDHRLESSYKDHKLVGNYKGRRECHIGPDLLLIYKVEVNFIIFERIGSHSELF